jgi:hypothetical protein
MTYRLPPHGPDSVDVCLALYWLLDEHNHEILQTPDVSALVFRNRKNHKTHRVEPETLAAAIDGEWVEYRDTDGDEELTLTNRGRVKAQKFRDLNKL